MWNIRIGTITNTERLNMAINLQPDSASNNLEAEVTISLMKPAENWLFLGLDILNFAHLSFNLKISCHSTPSKFLFRSYLRKYLYILNTV